MEKKENDRICVELYDKYADRLYAYGISLGFDKEVLHDAIHDVFLNLLLKKNQLKDIRNIRCYLFRSFYNKLMDFKRKKRGEGNMEEVLDLHMTVSVSDKLIDTEYEGRLKKILESMLDKLSPMQKNAVYMRYMYEMEYSEIAEILNVTQHAVRKFVSKGLGKLRDKKDDIVL